MVGFGTSLEEIMALNGWDTLPSCQRVSLLRSSMTRRAADVFSGFSAAEKEDYTRAKNELTRVFVNPAKTVLYQNEFDNKFQGPDEK
jgi:hypothetical protein